MAGRSICGEDVAGGPPVRWSAGCINLDEAIADIREVSVKLAASQREIELLHVRMKAEIKLETRKARNDGTLIGIGVAVLGFAIAR